MPMISFSFAGNVTANVTKVYRYDSIMDDKPRWVKREVDVASLSSYQLVKMLRSGEYYISLNDYLDEYDNVEIFDYLED